MFCRICLFVAWKARSGVTPFVIARPEEDANTLGRIATGDFQRCGEYSPMQRDYLTHLGKERLLSAVTEAKKSGWIGTGSAATNTVNNGTSAGVLALVPKRWLSKSLSICSDDAGILCPNSRLAGRVIRVMGREMFCLQRTSSNQSVSAVTPTPI